MSRDYSDEAASDQKTLWAMRKMMKQQRDSFRQPRSVGHVLGAAHSDETRKALAELLDWYLREYEAFPED